MPIKSDVQKLEVDGAVELFELDSTVLGGDVRLFHGHLQSGPIWWQGKQYEPWAIHAEGFLRTGEAQQGNPVLTVGNIGSDEAGAPLIGVITALYTRLGSLAGATLTVRRTTAKYLDAINFPGGNPTADPTQEESVDVWLVQQMQKDSGADVEFLLSSPMAFDGFEVPAGKFTATVCQWLWIGGYRGPYCNYTGGRLFDEQGNATTDPTLDRCGGRLSDCKSRFGEWEIINFGGSPTMDAVRA